MSPDSAELPAKDAATAAAQSSPIRTTGLTRASSGGVKNATQRYDLPPPSVAVRNLVRSPKRCTHMPPCQTRI